MAARAPYRRNGIKEHLKSKVELGAMRLWKPLQENVVGLLSVAFTNLATRFKDQGELKGSGNRLCIIMLLSIINRGDAPDLQWVSAVWLPPFSS